ncbi:mRNA splicing protein [Elasticomyces elasticus]|uniref:Pre-mRNA-splicing factor SLU7 n=1 Tax=Exophiala sideris TaxID=1016849 RepID=A0ABR0JS98_9EURO|nr:mRNA splicing protein [Elasticomyces elasticus]KAK5040409.1 mRNA splicing protein [Exophiala sideris]KAK5043165.1 mRNA splicing protein [Exophiala sideris]KAK5068787.1 mRNA splicing protein [Exophiala sideris]KAK5186384.1 mRNA splicing protein [Eurotiomycetes sp. CCFEE 6388]
MAQNKPPTGPDQSRNEYIPSFISKRPFWAETTPDADYLEHQRLQTESKDTLDKAKWYDRGKKAGPAATKFRKGACENCGAMTHKTKECLSRPRKQGAKWTGRDIQADEVVEDVRLGWDAKRDRWNGYDNREYTAVVREYEELEALKKTADTSTPDAEGTDADADARYGEETDMGRSQPTSTRQLRLREDTANYLKNLDLDSAKYDPKTRTMDTQALDLAANPSSSIAEEGFVRPTDDAAAEFERAQRYAWETQENANPTAKKLHLQANPTEGEVLRKKQTAETADKKAAARKALLDKYGGDEYLANGAKKSIPQVLTNERYIEYDESGHVKGEVRTTPKSKYAEDVLTNNHTSVWGSWWRNFTWGYCTGESGKVAFEEAEGMKTGLALEEGNGTEAVIGDEKEQLQIEQAGEDVVERKPAEQADTTQQTTTAGTQAKKRTLQELQSGISEEDLESYKRNRVAADDPMAALLGRDELVEMR